MDNKIWAVLMYLSDSQWSPKKESLKFDDNFWDEFLEKCRETGINMVVLDVGDGVNYKSHPEIAMKDGWSKERVHSEVEKCKKLGIELVPKLNFSSGHSYWMGDYRRMTSTKPYYDFCSDVIKEVYEIFNGPRFIHLGLDEECYITSRVTDYVLYRQGQLLIDDIKFLVNETNKTGALAWMWHDPVTEAVEEFTEAIGPDKVIISPWWYWAYTNERPYKLITDWENMYANRGITCEQDVPIRVNFLKNILPLMEKGYRYIPTPSNCFNVEGNTEETIAYFKNGSPTDEQILGFMTAPWRHTLPEYREAIYESLELLKAAREKHYGK